MSVLLPAPFSPMIASDSPAARSKLTSLSAMVGPNDLPTPCTLSRADEEAVLASRPVDWLTYPTSHGSACRPGHRET